MDKNFAPEKYGMVTCPLCSGKGFLLKGSDQINVTLPVKENIKAMEMRRSHGIIYSKSRTGFIQGNYQCQETIARRTEYFNQPISTSDIRDQP
jgi:hypothetical protein